MTTTDPPHSGSGRFRFSLRSIFILITLAAIWLGYRQFQHLQRQQRIHSAKSLALSLQAIESAVQKNLTTTPLETVILFPKQISSSNFFVEPSVRQELFDSNVDFLLRGKNKRCVVNLRLLLDVRQALEVTSAWGLRKRLLSHYESGLAELGLSRQSARDGVSDPNTPELWAIWMSDSQNPSATVWIRVRVDDEDSTGASVEVLMTGQATLD